MKIVSLFLFFVTFTYAQTIVHNGTVILFEVDKQKVQSITYNGKKLDIARHPTQETKGVVFFPIGYYQKKDMVLEFSQHNKKEQMILRVEPKKYKVEKLKVDSSRVKPPKKVLQRISKEYKEAMKIYATSTKKRYWDKPFEEPLDSQITSRYGNARIFNGLLKSFHGGTDYRAKVGTPIHVSNDGVVVLSKKRYYAGGSVIIDHGEGIYTCYYHLSQMPLQVGTKVKQGDVIGYSGKSGRVTGPHLHFTVMVKGKSVDSEDFLAKIRGLFEK